MRGLPGLDNLGIADAACRRNTGAAVAAGHHRRRVEATAEHHRRCWWTIRAGMAISEDGFHPPSPSYSSRSRTASWRTSTVRSNPPLPASTDVPARIDSLNDLQPNALPPASAIASSSLSDRDIRPAHRRRRPAQRWATTTPVALAPTPSASLRARHIPVHTRGLRPRARRA